MKNTYFYKALKKKGHCAFITTQLIHYKKELETKINPNLYFMPAGRQKKEEKELQ